MFRTLLPFLFLLYIGPLWGQMVTIRGQASDYAGKKLVFYTYPEPISHQPKKVAETIIDKEGNFVLAVPLKQTIEIYTDLEKYKGTLVAQPGEQYHISLPPWSPRNAQEAASPYFEPELYWLGIKGAKPTDLNFLVRAFLTDYNQELASHTIDLYQKKMADTAKAIISRLEKNYPSGKFQYLNTLKTCCYGELDYAVVQPAKEKIVQKYFAKRDVFLSHPAWQHLFNAVFSDYLLNKSQDLRQKESVKPALNGDFGGFVNKLSAGGLNKATAELVAVKSFYDGFYSNKFDKKSMIKGLKEAEVTVSYEPLKDVLPEIIKKVTSLQEGNQAPVLLLTNRQKVTSPLRAKGKFIYLAFFKSASKECRAELDSLVGMEKKLNTVLTIVPVSLDENFSDAVKLWSDRKYPWELFAAAESDKVRKDWLLKTVPTFYLISPDDKLVLSQALAPSQNFEYLFLKIYRESRFNQKK